MAVRSKEEILNLMNEKFKDDTSDEVISLIEDVSDTLSDYDSRVSDSTDWKKKYEDNDAEWRTKYKERFLTSSETVEKEELEDDKPMPLTYDNLFKTKE